MTLDEFLADWHAPSPTLTVHTSGSTGTPKPILVEKRRMRASAERTCRFLGLTADDVALLCMPLDYIAGKMVVVRSLVSGMSLLSVKPSSHPLRGLREQPTFVAMVPLQVWRTLEVPEERERLMRARHLIIGGGAIDRNLENALRDFPNAVWSTYGMTETLSHIALRRINGPKSNPYYTPMDGVEVAQADDGCLEISAPAICPERLKTNDIVEMAASGTAFRILGRKDNVICSGGIKLQAEQIEERLAGHLPGRFAITKRTDRELGEAVVLVMENVDESTLKKAKALCRELLPKYWIPKDYIVTDRLPLTETGKIARQQLQEAIALSQCPDAHCRVSS